MIEYKGGSSMHFNFPNVKKMVFAMLAAMLILSLSGCVETALLVLANRGSNAKVSNSIKDQNYKNKITDALVIFDIRHYEKALAGYDMGNFPTQFKIAFDEIMRAKFKARTVQADVAVVDGTALMPGISYRIASSTKPVLLIEFSSYELLNNSFDGYIDLSIKLFPEGKLPRDLSKEKAVWVAEAKNFELPANKCSQDAQVCADQIVTAIIDGLQADSLI
ncbi:MAG: hypothetical protein HOO95_08350 [Gallionella sp.]|nr:hypothetical protein [Gallionella sp.]